MLHGFGKFSALCHGKAIQFINSIGIRIEASFIFAMKAEFTGEILSILRLWTRWIAVIFTPNMRIATVIQLSNVDFSESTQQLAYLFLLSLFLISIFAMSRFSIDGLISKRSHRR